VHVVQIKEQSMLIDFKNIKEDVLKNFHGGDKEVMCRAFNDEYNKIMVTKMIPGSSNGIHKHIENAEIFYVLSGSGYAITDGIKEILKPGVASYCKKGSTHEIVNDGKVDLICFNVVCKQ